MCQQKAPNMILQTVACTAKNDKRIAIKVMGRPFAFHIKPVYAH